ncbi:kinetochore Sim4 complex subunit Fta4 [Xylariaceae sp. FL0255]|nr:kinetochore Sim4 complex subunit Fta4 [Xylariaceae sp. FL0255]
MAPPTIISHKSTFIDNQTLHLSQELAPSAAWRAANERAAPSSLPTRAVDDALYRLNQTLTQHARRVYAPQATRHIAEQIEGLFRDEAERTLRGNDDGDSDDEHLDIDDGGLRVGIDFATEDTISALPHTWESQNPRESTDNPLEAKRYTELVATLNELNTRRREARERVERLRRMAEVLKPFDTSSASRNGNANDDRETDTGMDHIQRNLITRNGEVERELERMRLLLVRVTGRIQQLPENDRTGDDPMDLDLDLAERNKVDRLLDGL